MEPEKPENIYLQLAEKWMNGTITPEEERVFAQWYNEDQNKEIIIPGSFVPGEQEHSERIWQRIQHLKVTSEPVRAWIPRVAASVLLLLVSAAAVWLFYGRSLVNQPATAKLASDSLTIRPVGDRAQLTLGNGSVVDLEAAKEGPIIGDGKAEIDKQDARVIYKGTVGATGSRMGEAAGSTARAELVYNTLTTPRGGMYSVVLSDGTKVWLNASSSLHYPTAFSGQTREVSLTGEAYFEVAQKAAQPFKVLVNGMEVTVLGTHFDVMAYDDESAIATTLLEGAVKVDFKGRGIALNPGQQSLLVRGADEMQVRNVDVDDAVAWKNGIFQFRSEDIKSVMRKVARWYDVDVRYDGQISEHFSGAVRRDAEVSSLLRTMELTHEVRFHVEGRTITVSP
jgi:ferric-dicitrate binding protein FerR (iron transport regulator)